MEQQSQQSLPSSKFHIVQVMGSVKIYAYDNLDDAVKKLIETRDSSILALKSPQVFIFEGNRLNLTKGRFKFLVMPDCTKMSLCDNDISDEIDEEGFINEFPSDDITTFTDDGYKEETNDSDDSGDFL